MATSRSDTDIRVVDVEIDGAQLVATLSDGRSISAPLDWFPRLQRATPTQRAHWRLIAARCGIHWPDLDEDLSVEGLLAGRRAPGSA